MTRWVVLLRGVNVGGGNRLPMADLRATLADLGLHDVTTYIQSGNVVLDAPDDWTEVGLVEAVRTALGEAHSLDVPVVARSAVDLRAAADRHPDATSEIDPRFLHVAFLDRAPDHDCVGDVAVDEWVPDRWMRRGRELYLTYPNGSGRSKMTIERFERAWDIVATARNLNTVHRLDEMANDPGD